MRTNDNFTYFNIWIICIWLQVFNEVKVTYQGEGHIKVKVKMSTSFPILCQIILISTHHFSMCGCRSLIRSSSYIKVKVKVKDLHPFKFYVAHTFCKRVVCIRLNAFLLLYVNVWMKFAFTKCERGQKKIRNGTDAH